MKNSKVVKGYLGLAGLLLVMIGGMVLFNPVEFKLGQGVDLGDDVSILNDVRASGALYLAIGLTLISGIFISRLTYTSTLLAIIGYLSVGIGRVVSIVLDGMPVDGLFKATIAEFVIALIGLVIFLKYKE